MKAVAAVAVILAGTIGIGIGTAMAEEKAVLEPGTWQYQAALETGSLPEAGVQALKGAAGRTGDALRTVESGGVTYRVSLDTP